MRSKLAKYGSILTVLIALMSCAEAGCSSCGGGEGVWDGPAWIEDNLGGSPDEIAANPSVGVDSEFENNAETQLSEIDEGFSPSISAQELQERLEGDLRPVIAYVSNTPIQGSYIAGSIALPSKSLVRADGSLKSIDELAAVLGNAGISEEDDLVIYGDCFSCGDATFVYWIMKYLGHQNVQILDGAAGDWAEASLPTTSTTTTRPAATYSPGPATELLADYESVASGDFVVVDARAPDQFGAGHIGGAINIDYNRVIEGSWLKDDSALAEIFADLEKDRPVAVYTKNGGQASIVWYALMLQGYNAKLYTWNDWLSHQP